MGGRGLSYDMTDFTGGLNTFAPEFSTPLMQSPDLDNLVLLDRGFTKRQGDVVWNSAPLGSTSTPIQGLGYVQYNSGTQFLNAIAGSRFYVDSGMSGVMADKTGGLTISAGVSNTWTPVIYDNLQIWFGGQQSNPDSPFTYSGSGNAASLAGSPPSAATAFVGNNRVFAICTAANPSRIYWSVLANPSDWTDPGSGEADVAASDGEALQCGVITGPDSVLLFKNSSSHLMVITSAPFPIYQLQKGIGVAGRNAAVFANGTTYIVTPGRRMRSTTDGVNFNIFPNDINDIWDSINPNRIGNIQMVYYQALEWIMVFVSTGTSTTNNYCIIWDIRHSCFLRCTTGFACNVVALIQNRRLFAGHYDGNIYEKDKASVYSDASVASPGAINAYWRTPFHGISTFSAVQYRFNTPFAAVIHPLWVDSSFLSEASTTMSVSYGFDFSFPQTTTTFSLNTGVAQWDVAKWDVDLWGGQTTVMPRVFTFGRGNLFSIRFGNGTASQPFVFQGFSVQLRTDKARKLINVV